MSGTIEIIGSNFSKKIEILKEIIDINKSYYSNDVYNNFLDSIQKIKNDYDCCTVNLLIQYHLFINSNVDKNTEYLNKKTEYLNNYKKIITQKRIFSRANRLFCNIVLKSDANKSEDLIKSYNNIPQYAHDQIITKMICEKCNKEMEPTPSTSQSICTGCGVLEKLYGTVFEDDQFYHQEGQRTKHGNYETNKHCKIWVERIQARESKDIPQKVIEKLKNCIKRDHIIDSDRITCEVIRTYLRQIKKTSFNEHVPLIRKLITGKIPPQLKDIETRQLGILFDKVINVFEKIKPPEKTNCPYHPYFIYKILDVMIKKINRKKEILSCIHLQSRDTLIENDKMWKKICNEVPEFKDKYKPTNRYENKIIY